MVFIEMFLCFVLQMMYLIFLMAYSYMILFEFRPEMRILEMIVLIWMGTFLIEEVREVRAVL